MKLLRVSMAFAAFFLAQTVLAQGGPPNGKGPIGRLQSTVEDLDSRVGNVEEVTERIGEIDGLTARIEALEADAHTAPDPSVAWRTYCRRTIFTVLVGDLTNIDALRTIELVQTASFIPDDLASPEIGTIDIDAVSVTLGALRKDDSAVLFGPFVGMGLDATYEQAGTRIDVTFQDGDVLTLYGGKDGSLLHGTNVLRADNLLDVVIVEAHFVEIDGVDATCGDEVVAAF
jgi:hypothetical protein